MKHRELARNRLRKGQASYAALADEPRFRDFVVLYIAEGYKRCRNTVSVCNSDPAVIRAVAPWMRRFGRNPITLPAAVPR